jgi:hypothetical protein
MLRMSEEILYLHGEFILSHLEKEIISLPQNCTKAELDGFRKLHGSIHLIVAPVEVTDGITETVVTAATLAVTEIPVVVTAEKAESTNEEIDEDERMYDDNNESRKQESSKKCATSPWIGVLANKDLVQTVQQTIARVFTDFLVSIGGSLKDEEQDGKVLEILINHGPVVHAMFNEILEKYPEMKELMEDKLAEKFVHLGF